MVWLSFSMKLVNNTHQNENNKPIVILQLVHPKWVSKSVAKFNFDLPILREAVHIIGDKFETEASGGITINTVRKIAQTGVDFISVGPLTHSAQSMDMSLKVVK